MHSILSAIGLVTPLSPAVMGVLVVLVYLVGAVMASGAIGGIRDEMEGVGDLIVVYFWPLSIFLWLTVKAYYLVKRMGQRLGDRLGTSHK